MQDLRVVSPDVFAEQRYREGEFYCDICGNAWPMSHQVKMRGGDRVGQFCCFERDGDSTERDLRRANASKMSAAIAAKRAAPPEAPDGVRYSGSDGLPTLSFITQISPFPIVMTRGGAAVPVTLTGIGFAADDDIDYGAAGITDSTPPVLVSSISRTLLVIASGGMSAGLYKLTFNDTIWQAVFDVR